MLGKTTLATLTKAGVRQREHETSRYESPASLEHAACILIEWIHVDEQAVKAGADREKLDVEARKLWESQTPLLGRFWLHLDVGEKRGWVAVAETARTMYGGVHVITLCENCHHSFFPPIDGN